MIVRDLIKALLDLDQEAVVCVDSNSHPGYLVTSNLIQSGTYWDKENQLEVDAVFISTES